MLPVIAGTKTTKTNILLYSFAMLPIIIAPYFFNFAGLFYLTIALIMTLYYNYLCFELFKSKIIKTSNKIARKVFVYSIFYLFFIYLVLLIDNAKEFLLWAKKKKNIITAILLVLFMIFLFALTFYNIGIYNREL